MMGRLLPVLAVLLLQDGAPRDMRTLVDQLGADEINIRGRAETEILARWKEWKDEDLDLLQEGSRREAEIASRTKGLVARIRIRQVVGETLLRTIERIDLMLSSGREEDVLTIVETIGELWKKGGLPGAEIVGALRWIRAKRSTPQVEEALKAIEEAGLKEGPDSVLPLLKDPSSWRRRSGIETLVHMMARDKAADLVPLLRDPNADVRTAAARALGRFRARTQAPKIKPLLSEMESHYRISGVALLARLGAREHAGDIAGLLSDRLPSVRVAALRALRDLGAGEQVDRIVELLKDPDFELRQEAVRSLVVLRPSGLLDRLAPILGSESPAVRAAGLALLGEPGLVEDPKPILLKSLRDPDAEVRWTSARALGRIGTRDDADVLAPLLSDGDWWVAAAAVEAFGRLGAVEGRAKVLPVTSHGNPSTRGIALEALGRMGLIEDEKLLRAALADKDPRIRESALWSLSQLPPGAVDKDILSQLEHGMSMVRTEAVDLLLAWKPKDSVETFRERLRDNHPRVRSRAAEAILRVGGEDDLALAGALLEDPFSWVRSRTALALARRTSSLSKGHRAEAARMLRRLEWDRKWDVEIAATIGLVRLGEKSPQEVRDLLDAMASGGSELGDRLYLELFDALAAEHAREASRLLDEEVALPESLEKGSDVAALLQKRGLTLESARPPRLSGRVVAGVTVSPRRLIEEHLTPYGMYVDGTTVRLGELRETLGLWRKKSE